MFIPVVIWRSLPSINHGKIAGSSSHKSFGQLTPESAKRFIREAVDPQGQKVFQCTLCRMSTKHHFSMQRHMVIKHTRPSSHLCQYCQASFPNKFYLIKHISDRICMKDVMFDPWKWINICKTIFLFIIFKNIRYFWFCVFDFIIILWFLFCFVFEFYLVSLFLFFEFLGQEAFGLRFVRTKEGGLTYQCGLCGYLPNSSNKSIGYAKNRVTMHIRNVHSESTNVVCGGCSKRFKNKESLRVHRIKYCRDVDKVGSPIVAENAAQ